MKSFTLDGKRHKIHPLVPLQDIRWFINNQHVGTPDDEITSLIEKRTTEWPRAARDCAKKFALFVHRKNQKLVEHFRL